MYTWVDGRSYTGEWLENNMSGHGVYKWQDGRKYEGGYLLDKKEGYGEYTWVNHNFLILIIRRMAENIWECGKKENKKDKEFMKGKMEYKEKGFGRMEIE